MVRDGTRSQVLLIECVSIDTPSAVGDTVDWVQESCIVYQIQHSFAQLVLDIVFVKGSITPLHGLTDGPDMMDSPNSILI